MSNADSVRSSTEIRFRPEQLIQQSLSVYLQILPSYSKDRVNTVKANNKMIDSLAYKEIKAIIDKMYSKSFMN